MKTVKRMIEELKNFPLDAECFAYEGEVTGLIINKDGEQGVIHCSEYPDLEPTIYLGKQSDEIT